VQQRSLLVLLPWLDRSYRKKSSLRTATEDEHPISGSDVQMCWFDHFHEGNVKKKTEISRHLTFKELCANINSQDIEQLHSSTKYSVHSLNNMKPVNHIFNETNP